MGDVKKFERENRYIVIKRSDVRTASEWQMIDRLTRITPTRECVVIESDWPECNFVWLMLEHRMAGYPVPDFNTVKCAADVQAALARETALREELDIIKDECIDHVNLYKAWTNERDGMQQRLTAAEQRNAELTALLSEAFEAGDFDVFGMDLAERLSAALKPTEYDQC